MKIANLTLNKTELTFPPMDKVFAGGRLRRLREERGMSQVELARVLAISSSYLNQIEHDSRPITATVLVGLSEIFGIDPSFFSPGGTARRLAELREALPGVAGNAGLPTSDLQQLAADMPEVTDAVVELHRRYREALIHLDALTDSRMSMPLEMPHELVRDFFYRNQNHFDALDRAAEELAGRIGTRRRQVRRILRSYLEEAHGVHVVTADSEEGPDNYTFNAAEGVLTLAPDLSGGQQAFRIATQLAYLEVNDLIDQIVDEEPWPDEATRRLARVGLAQHFAGALVLPYGPFFKAAERFRYDIEVLSEYFGVGYETVAHRLSTLQRHGQRGVPFIFVRTDKAGNISQRQSATSFHFSRSGGTCPLWNVYDAFTTPGRVNVQVAEMPDGQRYLWVARTVSRHRGGYGNTANAKTFVIGLGCELRQAGRLVYSDGIDLTAPHVTPIGPGCRTCDRAGCPQRAAPPIGRELVVDEAREGFAPYELGPRATPA